MAIIVLMNVLNSMPNSQVFSARYLSAQRPVSYPVGQQFGALVAEEEFGAGVDRTDTAVGGYRQSSLRNGFEVRERVCFRFANEGGTSAFCEISK